MLNLVSALNEKLPAMRDRVIYRADGESLPQGKIRDGVISVMERDTESRQMKHKQAANDATDIFCPQGQRGRAFCTQIGAIEGPQL